jgi:hypothetical protein
MDTDVKNEWTTRLRSGQYEQGRGNLRLASTADGHKYCCLGVLCEIAVEKEIIKPAVALTCYLTVIGEYEEHTQYPPLKVLRWAGLSEQEARDLAEHNDNGMSFRDLADLIEQRL